MATLTVKGNFPRKQFRAETLAECSAEFLRRVDQAWASGHQSYISAKVYRGNEQIAMISQNGRVWPVGEWTPDSKPIYCPSQAAA